MKDSNTILYDRLAPIGGLSLPVLGLSAGTPAAPPRPNEDGDGDDDAR